MKLFHSFLSVLLFTPLVSIIAQDTPTVEKNLFKIDIIDPGFTFEHGITKTSTLLAETGLTVGYDYNDYYGSTFYVSPFLLGEYRYYNNFERRQRKGKNTSRNSGNYIGLNTAYFFKPITNQQQTIVESTEIAAFYGLQRTYDIGLNIGFQAGIGYVFANSDKEGLTPYLRFSLSWVLGKKKIAI